MEDWSDDAFWEAMEPALCAPSRVALADADVAAIVTALRPADGAAVLDLGCGPGAHAVAFAARGFRVTGADRTRTLLARARQAAADRRVDLELIEADMRQFCRPSSFNLICSLYASFGYYDDDGNRRVLDNVFASLTPTGVFVLDLSGRETVARRWQERTSFDVAGVHYDEHRWIENDWATLAAEWTVTDAHVRRTFQVRQRLYAGTELRELLAAAGFVDIRLSGSLDGCAAYDHTATRLVAFAHAPARVPDRILLESL